MGKSSKESKKAAHVPMTEKTRPGSICAVKNIYRDPKDESNWLPEYPENTGEAAENEETAKFAVIVRSMKSADSRKKFEAHSIIIQSEQLQAILEPNVLKDYPGITCELKRLIFASPFQPLVHRWPQLQRLQRSSNLDKTTRKHVALLHDTLAQELGNTRAAYDDYIAKSVITWEYLWVLFEPGIVVVSAMGNGLAAYEVREADYDEDGETPAFLIVCEYIDWSGSRFGRGTQILSVPKFSGTRKIDTLPVCPLRYHQSADEMKARLTERGTKFEDLAGSHYRE